MMRQYELVERVQQYDPSANEALLNRAYVYAMQAHGHQKRASGDPFFSHPLEVAAILTELKLDDATIAAALLHDVIEDTDVTRAEIDQKFGKEIGALVEGLTKIKRLDLVTKKAEQAENFRKLLVAISSDIRVLLIKLADRLHNMRTLGHMKPESRRRVSEETLEIYAPLAGRMGMQTLREELEQLAFKWGQPDAYKTVVDKLDDIHKRNAGLVEEIVAALKAKLASAGLKAEVYGREKKPFSIWRAASSDGFNGSPAKGSNAVNRSFFTRVTSSLSRRVSQTLVFNTPHSDLNTHRSEASLLCSRQVNAREHQRASNESCERRTLPEENQCKKTCHDRLAQERN